MTADAVVTPGTTGGATASAAIPGDGDRVLSYYAVDLAGNAETANLLTVKIDRVAPAITASWTPAANVAGWNKGSVTVEFTCTDALSGIDTCTAPQTLSGQGANQSASGNATDLAGNSASASATGINIDLTPPVVAITGITNGATYDLGSAPQAGCTTSDALSGVAVSAVVAVTGGTSNGVGSYTVTCSGAIDVAGNTGGATATYEVHYIFNGFLPPISNAPVVNPVKAGQTVPVKFGLGGNQGLSVLLGGVATSATIGCSAAANDTVIEVPVVYPGASQFSYDAATGLYQFNWKTDKAWANSCRRLFLRLDDNTTHTADFQLKP